MVAAVESLRELPYLTRSEVAQLLRVHPDTVKALERKGELPKAIRVGAQLRYDSVAVFEAIDKLKEAADVA